MEPSDHEAGEDEHRVDGADGEKKRMRAAEYHWRWSIC
jgi:hypothetical protein